MLDNVNHISGVWGTWRGSVTQSLFFFFPPFPPPCPHDEVPDACQCFQTLYISLPHPQTHTHMLTDMYECAHPRTYIVMKHKELGYFKCSGCTKSVFVSAQTSCCEMYKVLYDCGTLNKLQKPWQDLNKQAAVPPSSHFYFWNGAQSIKGLCLKDSVIKACLRAMEKEHRVAIHMLLCDVALRKHSSGDWWIIRTEGGVGDESRLRSHGELTEGRWCPLQ